MSSVLPEIAPRGTPVRRRVTGRRTRDLPYPGRMPSYRARLQIGDVLPGHRPEEVLDTAEAAIGATHEVAAKDVEVVARVPRIVLRFTVPAAHRAAEDAEAAAVAGRMAEAVADVATVGRLDVLRREGGRWLPVSAR